MGIFDDLTVRQNGDDIEDSWFNSIRTALRQAFPGLSISAGNETIANNQASFQSLTNLELDETTYTYYLVRYRIQRSDASPDVRYEIGTLKCYYDGTNWSSIREIDQGNALGDGTIGGGDYDDLRINPANGVLQYKSSNMAGGSYVGTLNWKIVEAWDA